MGKEGREKKLTEEQKTETGLPETEKIGSDVPEEVIVDIEAEKDASAKVETAEEEIAAVVSEEIPEEDDAEAAAEEAADTEADTETAEDVFFTEETEKKTAADESNAEEKAESALKDEAAAKEEPVKRDEEVRKENLPQKVSEPQQSGRNWSTEQPRDAIEGRKGRNSRIAFLVSLLLVLAVLGGIYAYGYNYCSTHFMPGTRINGYDCSNMTEEEAEAKFAEAAKEYVLNIRFRGGSTEIVHARDMGFAYKPDGSVGALLHQQDKLFWPKYYFEDSHYEIEPGGTYDDEMLTQALQALPELQEENMEAPKNAYIEFEDGNEEEDGKFVILPETEGSTIDLVQLTAGVGDAAARYSELVDAEEIGGAYVEASLKADDSKIVSRCNDLNDIVGASITYELPSGDTMRLNSDVMKEWLVKDDSGKLVKDDEVWDEKLWEFLDRLAYNSNTIGMDRQFQSTLRGTITVSGGDYGYMVNQITEHDKLVEDLAEKKKETREPDYYLSPYNKETENDGIGTTYIEADLSAQHVWCYVNGELVMESDCVSGDTTTGHGTPTGVFGIMFMLKDTTLRGVMQNNGKYEYETKVGYWMPFYDGCGFHDAWWRTAFGGTIYQGNGSHGCINLPTDAAQTLFSYCDNNMPVVVYW